jgi:putative transposase
MTNHIHLIIIQDHDTALPKAMQFIQQRFAKYYGRRYSWIGHVWQGRYTSRLIADDSYFFQCAQYVENNPVKAGIVQRPEDYLWSSAYARSRGFNDTLADKVFPFEESSRREKFDSIISLDRRKDGWKNMSAALGSSTSLEKLSRLLGGRALGKPGHPNK